MPIIIVYGISEKEDSAFLEMFIDLVRSKVASIEELKIKKEQVSVFLQRDLVVKGLGEEIIIFVEGLISRPERTEEVKKKLAMELVIKVNESFPKTLFVDCIIKPLSSGDICAYGEIKGNMFFTDFRD
ncbi:hypothetical protein CVU82_00730 [Candidatus Falkowbacteria bacterium HGW-Falkowbacteria-1]|jgi:hypothetical protein|uniref:4-oxalocrotonate tautomerase domain-containing protein n=1 Tax=Candidatus Falkowbacteria bacterium HGW-Falkowbacteria-1 TaxID=2013768 RepID=A0A2N2EAJ8_9BACT|nr:MAG: hypothetical protein CVU82_00730 [Candidatus Falkowbacteria bacterium HGW-Falkowbacteria-1]